MGSYVESVDPTYLMCCDPQREIMEGHRNQVEGSLNFTDLLACWKVVDALIVKANEAAMTGRKWAEAIRLFREADLKREVILGVVGEAVRTTISKAALIDHELALSLLMVIEDPKKVRAFWELITKRGKPAVRTLDDWEATVFETLVFHTPLYDEELKEPNFEVALGDFRFFAGLNDPRVMVAVAWLEGDNTNKPVNDRKQRHRENGDWMLEFDSGRQMKGGKAITYMVIVHACAFDECAFEDRSTGEEDHVVLRRGRKLKNEHVARACIMETGELVTRTQTAYVEARKEEERWIEPISAYDRLQFFHSCITGNTIKVPDMITERLINAIADAEAEVSVV